MTLSALFSNGMVLQRNKKNLIWGKSLGNQKITITIDNKTCETVCDSTGYFETFLPMLEAGGPYSMTVTGDTSITIEDILVGDVFILGGQSNMEYTMGMLIDRKGYKSVNAASPMIRNFEVPKVYNFTSLTEDLTTGKWDHAINSEIRSFSAIAYYAALELYSKHHVPIGFIHSAVGGTPAKSWTSIESIKKRGLYTKEFKKAYDSNFVKQTETQQDETERIWMEDADRAFESDMIVQSGTIQVPSLWEQTELKGKHGAFILRYNVTLTKEQAEEPMDIHLGCIFDQDKTYINGTFVGTTGYCYPTRHYPIASGILHEGENQIEIRMMVFRNSGSITPGKDICLCKAGTLESIVDLSGQWEYTFKKEKEVLENKTFFIYYPAGLYQGMLYPIRKWRCCGFMYYQGESNVECFSTYNEEMKDLVSDWRKLFCDEAIPFMYVQLAGYSNEDLAKNGSGWADLRAQQAMLRDFPLCHMVPAYDLGEYNDLHPIYKEEVGKRMAMAADFMVYDTGNGCVVPEFDRIERKEDCWIVSFRNYGASLLIRNSDGSVSNTGNAGDFEAVTKDGTIQKISAILKDNTVIIPYNVNLKELRFAYKDCKVDANLYGDNGLPAMPFKIEI